MKKKNSIIFLLSILFFVSGGILIWKNSSLRPQPEPAPVKFDGERALQDVYHQTELGPRIPDSDAHAQIRAWMQEELEAAGWQVEVQTFEKFGHRGYNLVASHGEIEPEIILGAHYDSRIYADHDPDVEKRNQAVLGANDGASGVAILLELARTIPAQQPPPHSSIWLVFFDLEDNGNIPTWEWILGSRAFVDGYTLNPEAVVILDMLGDADLNIYLERNSDPKLRAEIWAQAAELGYENIFIPEEKFSMLDDHTPFLEAGMPAIDIIDFDYPYWHTTEDTADKIAKESLQVVGDTVLSWLKNKR
ncbi:MAG: M28 family peptidase [Anaerolineae bacterium]|jgi:glutaminyl-peptide cyclotransferase|nr:M28 family peptidase [Anaerolineae bacterium]MBT7069865.1 M28 family peptidase [Anaerolineae bacterium]MBT7988902.1 M28 family peptidase [Anaerolineae bacterium]